MRKLNTETVLKYISAKDTLVDIGCGNGYATAEYAKKAKFTLGIDYLPDFIRLAKIKYSKFIRSNKLDFKVGDILRLQQAVKNPVSIVVCERTLINLPTWSDQKKAILNIFQILKPSGKLLLTELTKQGHEMIDDLRYKLGLPQVEKYWSNHYLDEPQFENYIKGLFKIEYSQRFGTYCMISKAFYPLLIKPKPPRYKSKINKLAYEIAKIYPGITSPSHTKFYVLKKLTLKK
jgi:ubiquinone/menaquinone biosynthesis C-methylase UbiE